MYGENREDVAYMWQNYFDNEENVVEMELAFFIKEEDGRFTRFEEVHQQRAYTEKEVLKMLNLFIELPEEALKHEFKPFDKVLVRDNPTQEWVCTLLSSVKI